MRDQQQLSFDRLRSLVQRKADGPVTATGTGDVFEQMVLPALEYGGYKSERKVYVGQRLGGGKHIVDIVAYDTEKLPIYISLKWQQVGGTAEQKVPYETMCLIAAVREYNIDQTGFVREPCRGYVVLGGGGWTLREWLTQELHEHLCDGELVRVLDLYEFVALANKRGL